MPSDTGSPYNFPFPVMSDKPNVPTDLQRLAQKVHDQLALTDKKVKEDYDYFNNITKKPTKYTTNIVTQASGFTLSSATMWRVNYMCMIEISMTATADILAPATGDLKEKVMATWKTSIVPNWNYPLTSFYEGNMALGFMNGTSLYLSSLEAGTKWAKNTRIRFGGIFMTSTDRV